MKEIGSEFLLEEINYKVHNDFKLKNCLMLENARECYKLIFESISGKILFPSYACESMIQYIDKSRLIIYEIDTELKIKWDSLDDISINNAAAFVFVNYYGFLQDKVSVKNIDQLKQKGILIIEDTTHSIFSNVLQVGDYGICSLRKWFGVTGLGLLYSNNHMITINEKISDISHFNILRSEAFRLKKLYMKGELQDRRYLKYFQSAEKWASINLEYFHPTTESIQRARFYNYNYMKKRRRENYIYLMKLLETISEIKLICNIQKDEIPLFLPIYTENRDELCSYLVSHQIYCPIHWPQLSVIGNQNQVSDILNSIISIPIDQRYGLKDMDRIFAVINKFYDKR